VDLLEKKRTEHTEKNVFPRIRSLKRRFLSDEFFVDSERALLITESYRETEGEPTVIRWAKALKKILEGISTPIHDNELIVGCQNGSSPRSANVFPEMSVEWLEEEMESLPNRAVDPFKIESSVKKDLTESVITYWRGKTMESHLINHLPEETREQELCTHPGVFGWCACRNGIGHISLGFENVLQKGFLGIKTEAEEKLKTIDWSDPDSVNKEPFYKAIVMVCDAAVSFGKRYAQKARELAAKTSDQKRKKELERIAEVCTRVPGDTPRSFWEAVQMVWFVSLIAQIETNGVSITPGRFDQYMYPFYKKDRESGMNDEEILELIECYYIKLSEMVILYDEEMATYIANFSMGQNIVLSGIRKDGTDGTNELSYLCLKAMRDVSLMQPNLAVRFHDGTPQEFTIDVARTIRETNAFPEIMNDKVYIPAVVARGVPLKEARDWVPVGCVEVHIPGKTGGIFMVPLCTAKCLELALNNGRCRICERQMGPKTGDPRNYSSFEEILSAYRTHVALFVKHSFLITQAEEIVHAKIMPIPFASATMDDCIEAGKDMTEGGCRYNEHQPWTNGVGTVTDSLAAIKKYVFEEKKVTLPELLDALDRNFDGADDLRRLLAEGPKYGNDDEYADEIARRIVNIYIDEAEKYPKDYRGGKLTCSSWPWLGGITSNVPFGHAVGATPNGRLAGTPISEDASPTQGADITGVTACMRSVAGLDNTRMPGGQIFNIKINPSALEGEANLRRFADLNRAYMDEGGGQVQYNIVSTDLLKAAQKDPEGYKFLLVRVAGYSSLFVELSKEVQDDIIKRMEHTQV
jgi:pyruvate formate-lyase/glycerol dehydratase family glycyl radical enzyme